MDAKCGQRPEGSRQESVRSYRTTFALDEEPISEHSMWRNGRTDGIDWADVISRGGVAFGEVTRLGLGGHRGVREPGAPSGYRFPPVSDFDDPTALLAGRWGRDQAVKAVVFSRRPTEEYRQEIEIRLRSGMAEHWCFGYEVLWRCVKAKGAYAEIVRWNGKLGDFSRLESLAGLKYGVGEGDEVEASIEGSVIVGRINGVEVIRAKDDAFHEGSPGFGFNSGAGSTNVDHGLRYFEVRSENR